MRVALLKLRRFLCIGWIWILSFALFGDQVAAISVHPGFPLYMDEIGTKVCAPMLNFDYDRDGVVEIIVTTPTGLSCINSNGDVERSYVTGLLSVYSAPAVADIDGDGEFEIIFGGAMHSTPEDVPGLYVVDPDMSPQAPFPVQVAECGTLIAPVLYDLDGDGNQEILVGNVP